MPADHEAQSQVKEKRSSCRSEGVWSKPHSKKDGTAKFKIVGMAARVHDRETRVINAREGKYRAKVTRETETRHSANEVRETGGSSITQWCWTTQWQSIPESFLEVSRPSCGKLPHWRRSSDNAVAEYYTAVLE